jgi:hypothetical protein
VNSVVPDLIAALRHPRSSPVHVLVVTLSLGIGMAVSVGAFSVVNTRAGTVDPIVVLRES